jgi:hypothetical protein
LSSNVCPFWNHKKASFSYESSAGFQYKLRLLSLVFASLSAHFGTTKRPDPYMILLLNCIRWSNMFMPEVYNFGDTSPVLVGLLLAKK